ncbi:MAG: anaerobic sulfatase maturase [Promethearchaeota archaeon]
MPFNNPDVLSRFKWPPPSFHVMLKPSGSACNLDCKYCFYTSRKKLYPKSNFRMQIKVLERFTKQYIAAQKGPDIIFGWQGGEPLLMGIEFFKKALSIQEKYSKPSKRILNTIQTNGTLINDEWAKFFKENNFLVGISLDGPKKYHDKYRVDKKGEGSFDNVIRGLKKLQENDVEFNILACVNNVTAEHPLEIYRFFRDDLKVKFLQFIPIVEKYASTSKKKDDKKIVRPISVNGKKYGEFLNKIFDEWVKQDVGEIFIQIFDVTLGAWIGRAGGLCIFSKTCGNALAMEHNGDLYPCDHFVFPDQKRGNIMSTPLRTLVGSIKQKKFALKKLLELPTTCKKCKYLFACNGGCPKNRFFTNDSTHLQDKKDFPINYLCEGYKTFFNHVDPFMKYMAREIKNNKPAASIMAHLNEIDANEGKKNRT